MACEFSCMICQSSTPEFRLPSMTAMRRHVAIAHAEGMFSTFQCGHCKKRFYDWDHFSGHTDATPACNQVEMKQVALTEMEKKMFNGLVDQMARRIEVQANAVPTFSTPAVTRPSSMRSALSPKGEVVEVNANEAEDKKPVILIDLDNDDNSTNGCLSSASANEQRSVPACVQVQRPKEAQRIGRAPHVGDVENRIPAEAVATDDVEIAANTELFQEVKKEPVDDPKTDNSRRVFVSDQGEGKERQGEKDHPKEEKKSLNLCQLCVELHNDRPPIFQLAKKESHAMIHLRFSHTFEEMTDAHLRQRPEFAKVMKMCFERGFYDELKRQEVKEEDDEGEEEM